jgi:hypothetical protein
LLLLGWPLHSENGKRAQADGLQVGGPPSTWKQLAAGCPIRPSWPAIKSNTWVANADKLQHDLIKEAVFLAAEN